ncbi:DUF202 domain-containing protein [Rhodococcus opacus]|nr:DUF202 domain-containing protein [Rhodococcus opacus]
MDPDLARVARGWGRRARTCRVVTYRVRSPRTGDGLRRARVRPGGRGIPALAHRAIGDAPHSPAPTPGSRSRSLRRGRRYRRARRCHDAVLVTAGSDSGLQAERTALAWRRTTLAAFCVSAVLVHRAADHAGASTVPALLAAVATTALLLWASAVRGRSLRESVAGATHRQLLSVSAAVAVSAATVASMLWHLP